MDLDAKSVASERLLAPESRVVDPEERRRAAEARRSATCRCENKWGRAAFAIAGSGLIALLEISLTLALDAVASTFADRRAVVESTMHVLIVIIYVGIRFLYATWFYSAFRECSPSRTELADDVKTACETLAVKTADLELAEIVEKREASAFLQRCRLEDAPFVADGGGVFVDFDERGEA